MAGAISRTDWACSAQEKYPESHQRRDFREGVDVKTHVSVTLKFWSGATFLEKAEKSSRGRRGGRSP